MVNKYYWNALNVLSATLLNLICQVNAFVLFDDGSTTSYVTSNLVKKLQLKCLRKQNLKFNVFSKPFAKEIVTDLVSFKMTSLCDSYELNFFANC